MHLRRALLLFAVVLGVAALAASLSRPARNSQEEGPTSGPPPALTPGAAVEGPARLSFSERRRRTTTLRAGRSAVVRVAVEQPGQVELEGLGLTANAEPLTPARFDVLAPEPGRHNVRFSPASGGSRVIGLLRVKR